MSLIHTRKTALVSGAAQGLGEQISRQLHAAGYRVALADINLDALQRVAEALDPSGETTECLTLDIRKKSDFETALQTIIARWGGVDVLVNNAGHSQITPLMEISPDEFDDVVAINMRGAFLGSQVFGQYFKQQKFGRIINIASLAGQNGGTAAGAHYAASKSGVLTLTKIFAKELAAYGVTVNAIAPGPLDLAVVHDTVSAEKLAHILEAIPTHQLGDATFIAETVVLLASTHAASVTGACWDINCGLLMR